MPPWTGGGIHLRAAQCLLPPGALPSGFPFTVPAVRSLAGGALDLASPVTFFVGENGSGKSTLLEAIAAAAHAITVGSASADDDPTLSAARELARELRLIWTKRTHRGFYLRAEDFFGYAKTIDAARAGFEAELAAIDRDETLSSVAKGLASMPHTGQLAALRRSYGDGLDARSHGEAFLALFQSRLVPDGLYLLDEPEAPLSPRRQLALLAMVKDAVETDHAQFIIATHSPILMAYPGAVIYGFDHGRIERLRYEEIDHVLITRDFLAAPERFLRHL